VGEKRSRPRIWVTWLAAYLAGDEQCEWKLWFRANYRYQKAPRDRGYSGWEIEHQDLVKQYADELVKEGYTVKIEHGNEFEIRGKTADLAGKPDIIAEKPKSVVVVDCKTGEEKSTHKVQVLIYLWALRQIERFQGREISGQLIYKGRPKISIDLAHVTNDFEQKLVRAIKIATATKPPAKKPSSRECGLCDIPQEECPEKGFIEKLSSETEVF